MGIDVRGGASAEEVAAILAVLATVPAADPAAGYALWRATRLAALWRDNHDR
jgi:hypothetical protein